MSIPLLDTLNASRLIYDLQLANRIAQRLHGCLDAPTIACHITDGLVREFGCALARIWLVEPDRTHLKLVASSGLYSRTDGAFGRVPMGAFKVGKIAQNRVSFLSNNLPNEPWVKDREWALDHGIQGFAGYPLATPETVVGVLAFFSYQPLDPEFLEALLSLCTTTTVALGNAIEFQRARAVTTEKLTSVFPLLSDLLAGILGPVPLKLLGTERSLDLCQTYLFMKLAEAIQDLNCLTCGLTYGEDGTVFKAIVSVGHEADELSARLGELSLAGSCLGGNLSVEIDSSRKVLEIMLKLPYVRDDSHISIRVECASPVLHLAFSNMVKAAGFKLSQLPQKNIPLITDRISLIHESKYPIWVGGIDSKVIKGVKARLGLDSTVDDLRLAITSVLKGELWRIEGECESLPLLSEREREVMKLLIRGLRDRDIANQLFISESTVKFHINNTLAKLKAKTRVQAVYELIHNGWLN